MKAIDSIKNRLLDIELPATPPEAVDYTSLILIVVIAVIVIALVLAFFFSDDSKNKRLLSKLKANLMSSSINQKQASYLIADILKSSHNTRKLIAAPQYSQEWNHFVTQLSDFRYRAEYNNKDEIIKLIDDARQWLREPK